MGLNCPFRGRWCDQSWFGLFLIFRRRQRGQCRLRLPLRSIDHLLLALCIHRIGGILCTYERTSIVAVVRSLSVERSRVLRSLSRIFDRIGIFFGLIFFALTARTLHVSSTRMWSVGVSGRNLWRSATALRATLQIVFADRLLSS